jgi:hypothetical protein
MVVVAEEQDLVHQHIVEIRVVQEVPVVVAQIQILHQVELVDLVQLDKVMLVEQEVEEQVELLIIVTVVVAVQVR